MTVFERLRPAFAGFGAGCLIMALVVALVAASGRNPMPSAMYGDDVARAPAFVWALVQMGAASALIWGCFKRPIAAVIGAGALGLLFTMLAATAATSYPEGTAVMAMSLGAAPLAYAAAFYAWGAARGRE